MAEVRIPWPYQSVLSGGFFFGKMAHIIGDVEI